MCRYWDHNSMVWPPAERGAFTIASRASLIQQDLINIRERYKNNKTVPCGAQTNMECQWWPPAIDHKAYAHADAYMADLGNFTIRVSHSTWAPSAAISANSGDMEGELMKCHPGADCNLDASWTGIKKLPKTGGADQLLMRDILYAATPTNLGLWVFYHDKRYLFIESPAGLQRITVQDPCVPINPGDECSIPHLKGTPAMGQTCYIPKHSDALATSTASTPTPGMTPRPDTSTPQEALASEQQPLLSTAEQNAAGVGQDSPPASYGTGCRDRCWPGRMHKGAADQV